MSSLSARERRKRRILDNAENRLDMLRGVQDKKTSGDKRMSDYTRSTLFNSENSTNNYRSKSSSSSSSSSGSSSRSAAPSHSRPSYPIIVMLRLLAAISAAIAALAGLGSLILMSLVSSLVLAIISVMTSYSEPNGWMHSLPLLISTVSKRAGLAAYYGLRLIGVMLCVIQDILLAVFFAVAIGITREIIAYYW